MSLQNLTGTAPAPAMPAARLVSLIGLLLAFTYTAVLVVAVMRGGWLIDAQGHAADAYDWTLHKAAEVCAVGHAFDNYYGWHYPPTFLFAAAALALLPYTAAALFWLWLTLSAYVAAVRQIVGERAGYFTAIGSPAALWNVSAGQNGFLTAALIGGSLLLMQKRPRLAGICLGLLSYKSHFGLLFPVALIAAAQWRLIASAAVVTAGMAALSLLVFGTASWHSTGCR